MRWLRHWLVDEADRRAIDADLAELYEIRRRHDGERAAARWLRRQQLAYPVNLLMDRVRAAVVNPVTTMPYLWRDLSYSLRSLLRAPSVSATIILTVGVGLGATTAMVSVVRAVLVNPLPYAAPDQLVWIYTDNPPYRFRFSVVDYRALEADHPAFSAVAAYQTNAVTLTEGGTAERVTVKSVTGSYFPMLGQTAVLGRLFDAADDRTGDAIAVLTSAYWTRRFADDPTVLGRTVMLDGRPHTVVGVLQTDVGPLERDVAMFTAARWPAPQRKGPFFTMAIGRLRPDVPRDAAVETLRATNARLFPIWQSSYQDAKATWGMQDLRSRVVGDIGPTLMIVLAAVACVLLIACANAINLLIARALTRGRELAIRSALGASRGRLLQHLLVESSVLTGGAALVGLALAATGIALVRAYGVDDVPRVDEIRLSGAAIGWLALLAAASGALLFAGGLVPALRGARTGTDRALRSGGRGATDGPAARRLRRALVAAEFALATPLIVSAVLVIVSLDRLSRVPVGVDTAHILTGSVSLSGPRYARESDRQAFWEQAVERLGALPGVEAVAVADSRPPDEAGQSNNFDLEDRPTPAGENQPISTWVGVSPGFFAAVGLPHEGGRLLDARSLEEDVVVVDRAWADRFFPGQSVIGRRLKGGGCTACPWTTVVGVVGTVKWTGLDAQDQGTVYFPLVDLPNAFLVMRTAVDPESMTNSLRQAVREMDPGLALTDVATGDALLSSALAAPRNLTVFVGVFAAAALVLAVVGIYGVMAYFVEQQTRDIGIRLALGGEPSDVRRMVVTAGLRLVVGGVAIGVGAALIAARAIQALLFEVDAADPRALLGVPLALLAIATIACLVPGRRAARLDPAVILRDS